MLLPPLSVIESWPPPNYVDPHTRGNTLIISNSVFLALASVVIVLRLYTRLFIRKWFGLDDIFIVVAFGSTVALNVLVVLGTTKYGWNRHEWDIPITMATTAMKYAYVAKILFMLAGFATGFSLLAFYYRLIAGSNHYWFRWALHISVVYNAAAFVPFLLLQIFLCRPIAAYWEFPEPIDGKCMNEGVITMVGGVIKTSIDLLITTLPIPFILRTQMQKRQRYGVAVLFALGYVVTAMGALRCYYTYYLFYKTNDQSWWRYPTFLTSSAENDLAIICACVPTIRPLFPHFFGGPITRLRGWLTDRSGSEDPSNADSMSKAPGWTEQSPAHLTPKSRLSRALRNSLTRSSPIISEHDDSSELDLVIQKNVTELDNVVEIEDIALDSTLMKSKENRESIRTRPVSVAFGDKDIHPFDPRFDALRQV